MAKSKKSIIESFSYTLEEIPTIQEVEKIADREKRSKSFIIVEALKAYVRNHKEGNSQFTLDKSMDPGFKALPTIGEPLKRKNLGTMLDDDFMELAKAARARAQELNAEIERRGLAYSWQWNLTQDRAKIQELAQEIGETGEEVEDEVI